MRGCPACRRLWPDGREVCPRCLAQLVDDLHATLLCPACGTVNPGARQTCSSCLALLRRCADDPGADAAVTRSLVRTMATGRPLHRPPGRAPFASGPACTLRRATGGGPVLVVGADGLVEGSLQGSAPSLRLPLRLVADDREVLRVGRYAAVPGAVVARLADGTPLATVLLADGPGSVLHVRDGASAPVARLLVPDGGTWYELVETGGPTIAWVDVLDVAHDRWLDDEWTLSPSPRPGPLPDLALVAVLVAAKVLLGRPSAVPVDEQDDDGSDVWSNVLGGR